MVEQKRDIRKTSVEELQTWLSLQGEKSFRAKQIRDWVWRMAVVDWDKMANLPKSLREKLDQDFQIRTLEITQHQISSDGTIKAAFKLYDGNLVEGVLIPAGERMTACISSQVGCSLSCTFCATGYMARTRNLEPFEILDQARALDRLAKDTYSLPLSNIVMMGMGEPLLNYANVLEGIRMITDPEGMGWSSKRITLSTAGIAKMIRKLGEDGVRFNLALSLHAPTDEKRNQIMPINESNNLKVLREALQFFYQKTKNRITFEYIAFHDFNESLEDAERLAKFTISVGLPIRINIIEYNPIKEASFVNATEDRLEAFKAHLESKGLIVNIRRSRGKDIDAACGQLANKPGLLLS